MVRQYTPLLCCAVLTMTLATSSAVSGFECDAPGSPWMPRPEHPRTTQSGLASDSLPSQRHTLTDFNNVAIQAIAPWLVPNIKSKGVSSSVSCVTGMRRERVGCRTYLARHCADRSGDTNGPDSLGSGAGCFKDLAQGQPCCSSGTSHLVHKYSASDAASVRG